jgi:hypothetical protein
MSTSSQLSVVTQPKLEIRVRAERRTGELLRETSQNGQRARAGGTGRNQSQKSQRSTSAPRLEDHGISKDQSSDWQKLADQTFSALGQQETETESPHDPDVWRTGSAREEARCLFEMLQRNRNGNDVQTLRELIGVNDKEREELATWAGSSSPSVAVRIENMIRFRAQVLSEFDRLVENAHRSDSSQGENA